MDDKVFFQPLCEQPISVIYRDYSLNFPPHFHTALEAVFVFEGEVNIITHSGAIRLSAGDIAVVPSLVIHGYYSSSEGENCTVVFSREAFEDVENFIQLNASRKIAVLRDLAPDIFDLVLGCLGESAYYQNCNDIPMCINHGKILLAHLLRLSGAQLKTDRQEQIGDSTQIRHAQEILIYIQQHYREEISLESIAKGLKINKFLVSKTINGTLGTSLSELVNKYRLLDVCRFLENTGLPLWAISEKSGFLSENTMYRNFQKAFGTSPNEYRKNHRAHTYAAALK